MSRLRPYNLPRQRTNIWVQRYAAYITQPFDKKTIFYLNLRQDRNVLFQMSIKNVIQWSQPDLSKNKTKIKHHFVKITSLFSKNKTHFSRTNTHIFLLFLHKIPFIYTVSIPLIKVYNF